MASVSEVGIQSGRSGSVDLFSEDSGLQLFWRTIGNQRLRGQLKSVIDACPDELQRRTNLKAKMTRWNMLDEPAFARLAALINSELSRINKRYFDRDKIVFEPKSIWGASYAPNDFALPHDHYPATWSSVYYVSVPPDAAPLLFKSAGLTISPWEGLLLIFPGNVVHEVPVSPSLHPRVVVAANFYISRLN